MMNVGDVLEELSNTPDDQMDYVFRVNIGDETGDLYVDIDELEWDHENRVVKIKPEGYGEG